MKIEALRTQLYNGLKSFLSFPVVMITDTASERKLDTLRKDNGCVVWISKTTNRILTARVHEGSVFNIEFAVFVETNPLVKNAPNFNNVLDEVIKAVSGMEKNILGDYFSVVKTEEFNELPGNGLVTVYHLMEV